MCTVTYLPLTDGFLLTSNRDEKIVRKVALKPAIHRVNNFDLLFPQDQQAGGTWIATAADSRTVCLLNGANKPHVPNPPYKKSRGLVVLDYFNYASASQFVKQYNLEGIEPFTMLVVEGNNLWEILWNGIQCSCYSLNPLKAHIRSSSTLYTLEVKMQREEWFNAWLKTHAHYSTEDILKFHMFAGNEEDVANKVSMKRAGLVETVSITCVEHTNRITKMHYADVANSAEVLFDTYNFSDSIN